MSISPNVTPPRSVTFDAVSILRRNGLLIIVAGVVCGVASVAFSFLMRPIFRAETLVSQVSEQRGAFAILAAQLGPLASLAGGAISGASDQATALATLKSRVLTGQLIEDYKLLPVFFAGQWNAEQGKWKSSEPDRIPTMWDGYRFFDKNVRKVHEDRKSGLITLAIEWHDPRLAAQWANDLVRRANAKLQQDRIVEGRKTIAYLEEELAKAHAVEVRQALFGLIEAETKNIAVAHAREEFAFKVVDPAVPPRKRARPNRRLMLVLGVMVGIFVSAFSVLVRAAFIARRTEG